MHSIDWYLEEFNDRSYSDTKQRLFVIRQLFEAESLRFHATTQTSDQDLDISSATTLQLLELLIGTVCWSWEKPKLH